MNKLIELFINGFLLRSENVPISGPMLKEKAIEFAKELSAESFQASEGWLDKWKKRWVNFYLYFEENYINFTKVWWVFVPEYW